MVLPFDAEERARAVVEAALKSLGRSTEVEVSVVITDDKEIAELNREYRGLDRSTDVLSFPQLEGEDPATETGGIVPLGDIVISVEHVKVQAVEYDHPVRQEFDFLLVHGLLHLLGYDHDENNQGEMYEVQKDLMSKLPE
jgi:probable rRNA maturation factor